MIAVLGWRGGTLPDTYAYNGFYVSKTGGGAGSWQKVATPGITGLVDVVSSPAHATAVGLVLRSHRARLGEGRLLQEMRGTGTFGKLTGRIKDMFSGLF